MSKKTHGWILYDSIAKSFDSCNCASVNVPLSRAYVYPTRVRAREMKIHGDRVRKIQLNANGKAVRIIPGR